MTQDIQIYIDNLRVDIGKTSAIQIKKQFKDVKEYSKKKTSFSKPISVLYTQNNAALFGAAFNINELGGWDKNSRPIARIVINGSPMPLDAAKLTKITLKGYEFVIYKAETNLTTLLGNKLIRGNANNSDDISFANQYSFNFTRPNLRALMQSEPRKDGKGINYCYADLIGIKSLDYHKDRLMIPCIAVRELLEETMGSIGKTIIFSSGITKYLDSMYMPFNSDYKELTNEWDVVKYSTKSSIMDGDPVFFNLAAIKNWRSRYDKIQDLEQEFSSTRIRMDFPNEIGEYYIKLTCKVKKNSEAGPTVDAPEVFPKVIMHNIGVFPFAIKTELELKNITVNANPDDGITLPDINFHTGIFESTFKLQGGDISMYIGFDSTSLPNGEGPLTCSNDDSTFVEIKKLDSYYNEDVPNVISANNILPVDYKQIDLFNDIVTLFNAIVSSDGDTINLQTADEFNKSYDTPFSDWSNKNHEDKAEFSTLLATKSEVHEFEFLDSDDLYSVDYKAQFLAGLNNLNKLSGDKTVITNKLNLATTPRIEEFMSMLNSGSTYSTKLKPRILFVSSYIDASPMIYGLDKLGVRDRSITYFHILSDRFRPFLTSIDNMSISFDSKDNYSETIDGRKDISGTIFNRMYGNDEELTTNDDLIFLKSQFNLNSKDVSELDFNDIIFVKTEKNGASHYRLNELNNYKAGTNKPTIAELVQVDLEVLEAPEFISSTVDLNQVSLSPESEIKRYDLQNAGVIID